MTIGGKIKRIRQHRKMTQKELGDAVGLTANRIAQYEMGYRVPKDTLVEKFAEAMKVSTLAMKEPNTNNLFGIMETLLWMEEDIPGILMLTQIEKDSANLKASKQLAELLPQAELHIVPDAGHEINKESPEAIAAVL